MFIERIKQRAPFLEKYFKLLIDKRGKAFPQSIIFFGNDVGLQYLLALNLARVLNCRGDKTEQCECLNCRWIKGNKHPSVITVSKIDYKPESDGSKTVISVKQTKEIKNVLSVSSEYHRVFIFCDADIKRRQPEDAEAIKMYEESGYALISEEGEGEERIWYPSGLTSKVFQAESANSLLKSIEEPPPNTSFIFLTKDKNDLIETIISRSQSFFVPGSRDFLSIEIGKEDFDFFKQLLPNYPTIDRLEINGIAKSLVDYGERNGFLENDVIVRLERYIKNIMLMNLDNPNYVEKMTSDLRIINDIVAQLSASMVFQTTLENAFYKMYKR